MLDAVDFIFRHTRGKTFEEFENDELVSFAVLKNLEIIGEAANHLSDGIKEKKPDVEWPKIIKARHIFVHAYYDTDWQIVWAIVSQHLHGLREALIDLLTEED